MTSSVWAFPASFLAAPSLSNRSSRVRSCRCSSRSRRQFFQPAPAHRLLLVAPALAASENICLFLVFDQFDLHALAHVLPRLGQKGFLKLGEPSSRRADQI